MLQFVAICTLLIAGASHGDADTSVGVRVGTSGFEFEFLYGDHYGVEADAVHRHTKHVSEEDFLVALHLSRAAGLDVDVVVGWRRDGESWDDIRHRCALGPDVFYIDLPADSDPGPPYGRAWGHWKKKGRNKALRLSDDEVRAFVVLRALSDYTKKPVSEVLHQRRQGWTPAKIAAKPKAGGNEDTVPAEPKGASNRNGKAKSKAQGKTNGNAKPAKHP